MAAAQNALDLNGVAYLWAKCKLTFAEKGDIPNIPNVTQTENGLMLATDKVKLDGLGGLATTAADGLMSSADKAKLDNVPDTIPTATSQLINDSGFATSDQIQAAIAARLVNVYRYIGSVQTYDDLPDPITENVEAGDVYDVLASGMNYAWTGVKWDELGAMGVSLDAITNAQIDAIVNPSTP